MSSMPQSALPTLDEAARFSPRQIVDLAEERAALAREVGQLQQKIVGFQHQLDWFRRQIFGQKSEKRGLVAPGQQMSLGEVLTLPQTGTPPDSPASPVTAHTRRTLPKAPDAGAESLRFFDETRVPVETIELPNPEIDGLTSEQFEVIGSKETFRLAQRPGSYVVIKYVRPVIKLRATEIITCPPAPVGVLDGSRADVSFLAGLLLDKFAYHCVLRMRPLQYGRKQCFIKDEGRPLEVGLQEQASNHHKLRELRASVVSVAGKGGARFRQVGFKETNASEPLMTCRYEQSDVKTGRGGRPGTRLGGTCLLPNWHPA